MLIVKLRCGNAVSISSSHSGGEMRRSVGRLDEMAPNGLLTGKKAGYISSSWCISASMKQPALK